MTTQKASPAKKKTTPRGKPGQKPEPTNETNPPIDPGATLKQEITDEIENHRQEYLTYLEQVTCELIRQPTINVPAHQMPDYPFMEMPGHESKVVEILQREFESHRLEYKKFEKQKGRANIIASVGKGRKKLMLACPLDVAPPGIGWKSKPFEPEMEEGYLRGRGAIDAKGPIVAGIIAARLLKPIERQLKGQLLIAGIADTRSFPGKGRRDCGIDYLIDEQLIKPDFAITPVTGGNLKAITVAQKGRLVIHVKTAGKQTHGSLTDQGDNAILRMANFLSKLNSISMPFKPHTLLGKPTLNVGRVGGGTVTDIIPGECEAYLEVRYLPEQKPAEILEALRKVGTSSGSRIKIREVFQCDPIVVDPDNILVRSIQTNIYRNFSMEAPTVGNGVGNMLKDLSDLGAIPIGYGPGLQGFVNAAGEQVKIEQLLQYARILAHVTIDLFT